MASPSTVRVAAVAGIFAPVPGYPAIHGGQSAYIGRRIDHDAVKAHTKMRREGTAEIAVLTDFDACYPADAEHNAEFARDLHGISVLNSLRRMLRDGDIAPADAVTASWAGVPAPHHRTATQPAAKPPRRTTSPEGISE